LGKSTAVLLAHENQQGRALLAFGSTIDIWGQALREIGAWGDKFVRDCNVNPEI
jgi:hypothetical protein